eukprot:g26200.t1
MPYGFVCTGDMSDSREQQEIVRAFERTAQFLRKFLWPFPLGGGYAYLRYLAGKGDVEAMKKLLDMGVPAGGRDSQDEIEQAPVIYAAREGFAQACKVLAQYQADVNEVGGVARETALHVAVQHNKVRVVQTLLDLWLQAWLQKSARDGTVSCLQTLIAAAAMIDPRDTCEQTPVHIACFFGREDIVSKLFTARADVVAENIRGQTPRKVADRHSFSTLVQLIDKEIEKREIEEHYANEEREKEAQQALKAIEFDERLSTRMFLLGSCPCAPWPFELHRAHVQRSQQVSRDFCPCRNKGNSSVSLYDFSQFNLKPAECILFMTPCTFCGIDGKVKVVNGFMVAKEGSRRPCLQASRGTPEWQPWWPFEEAVTWCWALVIWWLRRSGRSAAGKKYRTDRQDVENFNDRYNLLSYAMMASDNKKYRSFQRAIQQSIEHWASLGEDTVVLEIGCGAYAPFARLCADEGAKQVYAVEGNTWAAERAARKVPANVQVFAGLSQQLPSEKLAPRPNVVVMETIGDWAANEFMVSTFLDASRRLCRPDTKWIPGQVRTCYVPVETPTWGCEIPPGLWLLGSDDQRSRRSGFGMGSTIWRTPRSHFLMW